MKVISAAQREKISKSLKGHKHTEQTKRKMSKSHIGKSPGNKGKKHSKETKEKISKSLIGNKRSLGFHHSEETKKAWSKKRKGKKFSELHKKKISEAKKKYVFTEEHIHNILSSFKFRKPTSIELKVQEYLKKKEIQFEPQMNVGRYIADIYIPSKNLIIECDGEYWHSFPDSAKRDLKKDHFYFESGYNVLRLSEQEIKSNDFTIKLKEIL